MVLGGGILSIIALWIVSLCLDELNARCGSFLVAVEKENRDIFNPTPSPLIPPLPFNPPLYLSCYLYYRRMSGKNKGFKRLFLPLGKEVKLYRYGLWLFFVLAVTILLLSSVFNQQSGHRWARVDSADYVILRQWHEGLADTLRGWKKSRRVGMEVPAGLVDAAIRLPKEDLNSVDALRLRRVKGIGKVLSKRIVDYRMQLGGFVSFAQLAEIARLNKKVRASLKKTFRIDTLARQPLAINVAPKDELLKHPYLSKEQVNFILFYRPFANPQAFYALWPTKGIWSRKDAMRLRPYLSYVSRQKGLHP